MYIKFSPLTPGNKHTPSDVLNKETCEIKDGKKVRLKRSIIRKGLTQPKHIA